MADKDNYTIVCVRVEKSVADDLKLLAHYRRLRYKRMLRRILEEHIRSETEKIRLELEVKGDS